MPNRLLLPLLAILCCAAYSAQELGQHACSSTEVKYLLYLPDTYGKDRSYKWPLILFLHGYGERGNDLELLRKHPLPQILELQTDFPFIVVSPQLPGNLFPWDSRIESLNILLDGIQKRYSVDPVEKGLGICATYWTFPPGFFMAHRTLQLSFTRKRSW